MLIHRIDKLIQMKANPCYQEFACQLEISPAKLYRLIDLLREDLEALVIYNNKQRGTFEYECEGCITMGFGTQKLTTQEMSNIAGGYSCNYFKNYSIYHAMRNYGFNLVALKTVLNLNY